MPYSVISGFMSGIGVMLVLLQVAPLLGQATPAGGALAVLQALPDILRELRPVEAALGLTSLAILFLQPASWRRFLPPQLAVLLIGTIIAWLFLGNSDLRLIGSIPTGLPALRLPLVSPGLIGVVLVDALLLAMLGCVDTLLTAMIADSLTRSQHDSNRELVGQGIANIVSGLFGGLPGAGATMGTVVNIQSGASTPRSGVIRALILLVSILLAAPLLERVPMAVLAAITLKVGVDILDWSFLRRAHRVSYAATFIMYGVLILTVLVDLMVAVGIGVFIANIITIERLSRVQSGQVRIVDPTSDISLPMSGMEKDLFDQAKGKVVIFHLSGPMIFGVAKAIAREHRVSQGARILIVDLGDVPLLSTTIGLAIENVILDTQAEGLSVIVSGANGKVLSRLEGLGVVGRGASTISAATREEALRCALSLLRKDSVVN
jgi:SulP family sulfate permease